MATITDNNSYIAALAGSQQRLPFTKASGTSVAGGYLSLWPLSGLPGNAAASAGNTTTGVICTSATAGAFAYTNAVSGNIYLNRVTGSSSSVGTLVVYDRLWHAGAFTSAATTINANASTALTRSTSGQGVELWAEIATALSATATTITATYTNQDGVTGRTATCVLPASAIAYRMFPFTLQSGDTGVRAITNLAGSAAPTGTFNILLMYRLAELPLGLVGLANTLDFASTGLPIVEPSSCLTMMYVTNTTSTGTLSGSLSLIG